MRKIENFIERATKVHNGKYDYSEVNYVNTKTKVCIICPEHGKFWQNPGDHLRGHGCPACAGREVRDLDSFIKKARSIYGNKYDYSKTVYKNSMDKVIVTCPIHGDFLVSPNCHINMNTGCPKCNGRHLTTEDWIERFRLVHGDKYDYSKVKVINNEAKVCIICPEHGKFWKSPAKHYNGKQGCPVCSKKNKGLKTRLTQDEYVKKANEVHQCKYDYSVTSYVKMQNKVKIICPKHGEFEQLAYDHVNGHGCPVCANLSSNGEKEIYDFLVGELGEDEVIRHDRIVLGGRKEIDIYIPRLKVGIEYNGLYWHSEARNKDKYYHYDKTEECEKRGIRLIEIFEDEYINQKDIVLSKIRHLIGKDGGKKKASGRKSVVRKIMVDEARGFLDKYHIQGYGRSTVRYGAYFNNELVGVMTFVREKGDDWELNRFATDYNYICQGIGGKLFKSFVKEYDPDIVKSFADRRWSTGIRQNIYERLGFAMDKKVQPDYRYLDLSKPSERIHKFNMRKKSLSKKYGLPLTMTESEMTERLGFVKIWDCGLLRYMWKKERQE